jgi:8-amino-7-oxononanoate synthase
VTRRHGGLLVVDEAHALGVVGAGGEGAVAAAGLGGEPDVIRTVTLSKALVFDTGLAPACAAGALESLRILAAEPELSSTVRGKAGRLAAELDRPAPAAAVLTAPLGSPDAAVAAAARCAELGVHVGCFRPPSVPDGVSRLRLTARANLSDAELDRAVDVVREAVAAFLT